MNSQLRRHEMAHSIAEEITEAVNNLPPELQKKVLEYARGLEPPTPQGISGKELLRIMENITISPEDLKAMADAIEEDCERIDLSEEMPISR
jgi:exoribonuclease R